MCDICLSNPHLSRCPNAPEPPTVYTCDECGEAIYAGDEYVRVDGKHYHLECTSGYARVAEVDIPELDELY